jgi:nitric oxide reductase NorD protein
MSPRPLTAAELEARLDEALDPVLSSRRTATPLARALEPFTRAQQDFALRWVDIIAKTNAEMAYQFAARVPEAFRLMDLEAVEGWIIRAMDVYDRQGLYPGCSVLHQVAQYAESLARSAQRADFEDLAERLRLFVHGLAGRALKLEVGERTFTDTNVLYLPPHLALFPAREANARLYKAIAAHLWAQCWYGTFRPGLDLVEQLAAFPDAERARRLFALLETVRLDACIQRDLPGLYRDLAALHEESGGAPYPEAWGPARERLARPSATVYDTLAVLRELYAAGGPLPRPRCYEGEILPEHAAAAMRERIAREKQQFRTWLARLLAETTPDERRRTAEADSRARPRFAVAGDPNSPMPTGLSLLLDGQPIAPPAELRALMHSIYQDLGEIPDEYLVPAGPGDYDPGASTPSERRAEDVWKGSYHEEGAFLYNEWDHKRAHYRKDWCVLRELEVPASDEPFVARTLDKYRSVLPGLRRSFEALRGEDRLAKKQPHGDDVDLDALVEAYADLRTGREMGERLYTKRRRLERHIAVMFLVDMSGSTKGWINDAERESLVLLAEALEILGDRYAIYGFSGMTRKRCELYRIKRFEEPYDETVHRRIAGIRPQDYTRMGVVIRHLVRLFEGIEARTKLLITLSDGKPDDYDGYRGEYGIEDTRMALIEAKRAGIHPFCITIDSEARAYLPHLYGAVNWVLVDDVRRLPLKVADIYRRLTL